MSTEDNACTLMSVHTQDSTACRRPGGVELVITCRPARPHKQHWYTAMVFDQTMTVKQAADKLRALAALLEMSERTYGAASCATLEGPNNEA